MAHGPWEQKETHQPPTEMTRNLAPPCHQRTKKKKGTPQICFGHCPTEENKYKPGWGNKDGVNQNVLQKTPVLIGV